MPEAIIVAVASTVAEVLALDYFVAYAATEIAAAATPYYQATTQMRNFEGIDSTQES